MPTPKSDFWPTKFIIRNESSYANDHVIDSVNQVLYGGEWPDRVGYYIPYQFGKLMIYCIRNKASLTFVVRDYKGGGESERD